MWQNNFMKSFLLQVIFLFTFFFAEDASADKKLPVLEKDLYLKGLNLFFNDLSRKFYGYELLIRLHNVDDEETMRILETCEREYQEGLRLFEAIVGERMLQNSISKKEALEAQLDKVVVGEPSPELENIIKQNVNQALEPTPPAAAAAAAGGSRKKKHRNRSRRKKRK